MNIQAIRLLVEPELDLVTDLMREMTKSEIGIIDDLAQHIMQSGGKRLRPILVLLSSNLCNYVGDEHIKLAAMVELFHTATLLHDDVVDDSSLRRGRKTAHEIWGSKASILVGDYLLTLYMKLMIDLYNKEIMHICTDLSYEVTCGELQQLGAQKQNLLAEEHYFRIIRSKTALLFAAACRMGGVISSKPIETQRSLYNYGLHFGNAFQIIDDALDYCGDPAVLGKNVGDDLANGKYTLPLLYAHKYGSPIQKNLIEKQITEKIALNISDILEIIADTKALEQVKVKAKSEALLAISALENFEDSKYKSALIDLVWSSLDRSS